MFEANKQQMKNICYLCQNDDVMARKGTKLEFLDEMHDDLMRNFKAVVLESEPGIGMNELCEATVNRPARRFYISTLQAYKVVSQMRKGNTQCLERMPEYRQDMFREINRMVDEYMMRYEFCTKPLLFVVAHVLSNRAPRFYVSAESMRKLYYSNQRKKRCKGTSL